MDPNVGPFVPNVPSFTFRRARSLQDQLVASEFKEGGRKDPCKLFGSFTCGGCGYCRFMNTSKNLLLPNGEKYSPRHFANCSTPGVVYLLLCECACFYVGKTAQEFWRFAYRHLASMRTCNPSLPLGRHVTNVHDGICPKVSFVILDRVHPGMRGGDWNKTLLQREQRWIFRLNATSPPGLNGSISFRPFLEGFSSGGSEWEPPDPT